MQKKVTLYRIKPERLTQWVSWCREIETTRREEALETLADEKVSEELFLLINQEDNHYAVGFARGEMLPANNNKIINKTHKKMKSECLEYISSGEVLYHLFVN